MDTAGSLALLPSPEIQTETVVVGDPAQTRFGQGAGMPLQHQLRPQSLVTGQPLDGIFQQQLPGIAETDGQGASDTVPGPLLEYQIITAPEDAVGAEGLAHDGTAQILRGSRLIQPVAGQQLLHAVGMPLDRKSTRLNSSHVRISYA